jgi:hypothetical protein
MAKADDEEPLLLGEDCLVDRPPGVFQVVLGGDPSARWRSGDTAIPR